VARDTSAVCKKCRRENEKLFLKGTRCLTDKCAIERRSYAPGQHGQKGQRISDYGRQLREKQKIRRIYCILENQFRNIYKKANQRKGVTGDILLQLLESRLDSLLYRAGIGSSRAESRQIIRHNGVKVNDKNVNIPSFTASPGDKISLTDKLKKQLRITTSLANASEKGFPDWLEVNTKDVLIEFKAYPARSDLPSTINEGAVVELYSK